MAYTPYPDEASTFSRAAVSLANELVSTGNSVGNIARSFSVSSNEDYLTIKTLDSISKIKEITNSGCGQLSSLANSVSAKAQELEEAEKERQEALKAKNKTQNGGVI